MRPSRLGLALLLGAALAGAAAVGEDAVAGAGAAGGAEGASDAVDSDKSWFAFSWNHGQEDQSFFPAAWSSLMMILVAEFGDKTFFIAALMSMRHGRLTVFVGAILALILMHALSCFFGQVAFLLPRAMTQWAATLLFFGFGIKMLVDARDMTSGAVSSELEEVEHELAKKDEDHGGGHLDDDDEAMGLLEAGELSAADRAAASSGKKKDVGLIDWKMAVEIFTVTFFAEWGDRSMIATIAMAADRHVLGVLWGGGLGHAVCTGVAVVGGKMVTHIVSEKSITVMGGVLFVVFGLHNLWVMYLESLVGTAGAAADGQ